MGELYVALVHHPVYDKNRHVVTSSVTNIDVHDIARSCRTYGIAGFYVVTPVDALRALVRRVMRHWEAGSSGAEYNPTRTDALQVVRLERTLEGVVIDIEESHGTLPRVVATTARPTEGSATYPDIRRRIEADSRPWLLLLGTGWGLVEQVLENADAVLEPLEGPSDFNHLSVRAAAAIILDRLRGTR
jgi:hypothetical protein